MMPVMILAMLSLGAIYVLIPIIIIIILIAAAAGISRGTSIFTALGIGGAAVMTRYGKDAGIGGGGVGKGISRGTAYKSSKKDLVSWVSKNAPVRGATEAIREGTVETKIAIVANLPGASAANITLAKQALEKGKVSEAAKYVRMAVPGAPAITGARRAIPDFLANRSRFAENIKYPFMRKHNNEAYKSTILSMYEAGRRTHGAESRIGFQGSVTRMKAGWSAYRNPPPRDPRILGATAPRQTLRQRIQNAMQRGGTRARLKNIAGTYYQTHKQHFVGRIETHRGKRVRVRRKFA